MTYWTFTDDLACDVANDVVGLRNVDQDADRKAAAARYLAARVRGLGENQANDQANQPRPKPMDVLVVRGHKAKRGDRFIHRHFIREGATAAQVRADPENEEFYEERIVTAVRGGKVYHRPANAEFARSYTFETSHPEAAVRRWL